MFLCLFPFYLLIINCTRASSQIQQGFTFLPGTSFIPNITKLLNDGNVPIIRAFGNSLFISGIVAILTCYFSAMTAYGIHMYRFKLKKAANVFILLVMMVPSQISSLGLVTICLQLNLMDNYLPIIIPAIASPVTYFFMKQYLESILPFEMVEAARVDGSSEFRTFHQIILPIMKPALAVQFIFAFVNSWNNFFIPALLIRSTNNRTLPLIIANLQSSDPTTFDVGVVYVLMAMAIIPLVIVYFVFSKYIIKGITLGSVKG